MKNYIDEEIINRCQNFQEKYEEVINLIKQFDRIAVFRHQRPDYDAIGSQLGMVHFIKENFPEKEVIYTGDHHVSLNPQCFPYMMDVKDEWFKKPFLAIVVDTSNSDRVSDNRFLKGKKIIKIDHHPDVDHYGDVEIVDTSMSAAGELIANMLIKFPEYKINKECATNLYKAIVGDSGRFLYSDVNAHTFAVAEYLVKQGLDLPKIYNEMYSEDISSLNFTKWVIEHYQISKKGVAYYVVDKDEMKMLNIPDEKGKDCLGLFDHFSSIKIWASITYDEAKKNYRVSLRSNGIDIEKVAIKFRGGGHAQASGAKLKSLKELPHLIEELDKLID